MEATAVSTIVSIMIFLFSAALVISGWTIIYTNAGKIANRSERFSQISSINNDIRQLSTEALIYWNETHLKSKKDTYILTSQLFSLKTNSIKSRISSLKNPPNTTEEIVKLRRSITLDAESPYKVSNDHKIEKLEIIISSCDDICSLLLLDHESLRKSDNY
jgi:biopolymer transport protein ExbB/TolQ